MKLKFHMSKYQLQDILQWLACPVSRSQTGKGKYNLMDTKSRGLSFTSTVKGYPFILYISFYTLEKVTAFLKLLFKIALLRTFSEHSFVLCVCMCGRMHVSQCSREGQRATCKALRFHHVSPRSPTQIVSLAANTKPPQQPPRHPLTAVSSCTPVVFAYVSIVYPVSERERQMQAPIHFLGKADDKNPPTTVRFLWL